MSLITKTTLFYLLVSLLVFGIGGVATYYIVQREVIKETDFMLRTRLMQIAQAIDDGAPAELLANENIEIEPLTTYAPRDTNFVFADTLGKHPYLDRPETYRKATVVRKINDQIYRLSASDVFIESDDIYEVVVDIMLRLFLFLGSTLLIFSFLVTRWLFHPFQRTLNKIRAFTLKKEQQLDLPRTSTKEFRQLNRFVEEMTEQARHDYKAVKEFSENASHEMQTPLSIARGKLELLLETSKLSEEQLLLIQSTQQSLNKLSKMGEALLLLTKIDNNEFTIEEKVNFSKIVQTCICNFEELAMLQQLDIRQDIQEEVHLQTDPVLADILVVNLVKNAIRHNVPGGWISVELDEHELRICNTGQPPQVPTQQLFERFQKSAPDNRSLGLGLAIVKKICEVNDFDIFYQYQDEVHRIQVKF